jgi:hypothetical protein
MRDWADRRGGDVQRNVRLTGLDRSIEHLPADLSRSEGRADLVAACVAYTRPSVLVFPAVMLWLAVPIRRTHTAETLRACLVVTRADGMVEQRPMVAMDSSEATALDPISEFPVTSLRTGREGLLVLRVRWGPINGWVPARARESWARLVS